MIRFVDVSGLVASAVWLGLLSALAWLWVRRRRARPAVAPADETAELLAAILADERAVSPSTDRRPALSQLEADAIATFCVREQDWLERCAERVDYIDAFTIRRTMTREQSPRTALRAAPPDAVIGWSPVTWIDKRLAELIEVYEPDGMGVALLDAGQADRLAAQTLVALAERILGSPVPTHVHAALTLLPGWPVDTALAALDLWQERAAGDESWGRLESDEVFTLLCHIFARGRLVVADVPLQIDSSRTWKVVFEERVETYPGALHGRIARAIGWRHHRITFAVSEASAARRYRFEVEVPGEDLEIRSARIFDTREGPPVSVHGHAMPFGRTHAVVSLASPDPAGRYHVEVLMGARRGAFVIGCVVTTGFVVTTLGLGLFRLSQFAANVDAASTVLGLLPSLLAGLLVRQGEHGMAARIFAGLRSMLLLSACSALIAVLSLIGGYSGGELTVLWATAFALALAAFVASLGTAVLRGGRA